MAYTPKPITDLAALVTKALPAANATANSASIDLWAGQGSQSGGVIGVENRRLLKVKLDATPNLADTKTVTIVIKDSADNSSFTAIDTVAVPVITASGGAGGAALERDIFLPPHTRRYVRAEATIPTSGGDSTAKNFYIALLPN